MEPRPQKLVIVAPGVLGQPFEIAARRPVLGLRVCGRLFDQRLQALRGGRVIEIVEAVELERAFDDLNVLFGARNPRLIGTVENARHDQQGENADNDDDDENLEQGETGVGRRRRRPRAEGEAMTQSEQAIRPSPWRFTAEQWRTALLVAAICVISLLVQAFDQQVGHLLLYDRAAVQQGEVWRVFTAPFVHATYPHVIMNMIGVILALAIFLDAASPRDWILIMLASTLAIGVGMLLFVPSIGEYIGFSGTTHGLYAGCAVLLMVRGRPWFGALVLALVLLEVVYETLVGPIEIGHELVGGRIATEAHGFGVFGGLVAGIPLALLRLRQQRRAAV